MAQLVKNPPAMQETWVRSLSGEDPLEKGKATHSSIFLDLLRVSSYSHVFHLHLLLLLNEGFKF